KEPTWSIRPCSRHNSERRTWLAVEPAQLAVGRALAAVQDVREGVEFALALAALDVCVEVRVVVGGQGGNPGDGARREFLGPCAARCSASALIASSELRTAASQRLATRSPHQRPSAQRSV